MSIRNTSTFSYQANRKFHIQKRHAKQRGIPFIFTYQEWVNWWQTELGPDWIHKRGRKTGQYVMARNNDVGPYAPSNVRCVLCSTNQREQLSNGTTGAGWSKGLTGLRKIGNKLTEDQVILIYTSLLTNKEVSNQFDIDQSLVSKIKNKKVWKPLTDDYDRRNI